MGDSESKRLKYQKALEYEIFVKEEYWFAKEKIKQANCIFDIWGHVGYFSKRARSLNSYAKIYYFEPFDELYLEAKENIWWDVDIVLNNLWIAWKTGDWELFFNDEKTMQSSKFISFLNPWGANRSVNFLSLSEYIEKQKITSIDVLKMDIEGMEFEVLDSFKNEWSIIHSMIIEIHLLNEKLKSRWNLINQKLKDNFLFVEIKPSWYSENIFLVWAYN